MSSTDLIVFLSAALAAFAWVAFTELRIKKLSSKLLASEEKVKDEEIVERVHHLSDADLQSEMSDFLSRTDKPKT